MPKYTAIYSGDKHCVLTHEPSGAKIETDAPKDNQGKGEKFSPSDLVGAGLGSCILTTMAIVAERDGVSIVGAKAEVEKEMIPSPRRIGALRTTVTMPASIPEDYRAKLERAAHHCPVHQSLSTEMDKPITFIYE